MPDCNYCEESFADEDAYLDHLAEAHDDSELSRIDQRRVEQHLGGDGGGFPTGPVILAGLLLFTAAVLAYATFFVGPDTGGDGAAAQTPYNQDAVHEHGMMNVTIEGERIDFSQSQYQNADSAFHFEGGNGRVWHTHAQGVTLEYAMDTLGIQVNETAVTYDGETYRASDPSTRVIIQVNGEPVNPRTYELRGTESVGTADQGDHVRIVVRNTSGQS